MAMTIQRKPSTSGKEMSIFEEDEDNRQTRRRSLSSVSTDSTIASLPKSFSSFSSNVSVASTVSSVMTADSSVSSNCGGAGAGGENSKPPYIDGVLVRKRKIWHQEFYSGPYNGGLQYKVKAEEVNVTRAHTSGYTILPPYAATKQLYQHTVPANHIRFGIPNKVKMTQDHLTYDVASQLYRFLIEENGWSEQDAQEIVYKDVVSLVQVAGVRCLDIYWSANMPSPVKTFRLSLQGHALHYIGTGSDLFKTHFSMLISNVPRNISWDDLHLFIKLCTGELQEQGYDQGPKTCLGHWTEVWQQVRCRLPDEPKVLLSNFVVLVHANEEISKRLHKDPLAITKELRDLPSNLSCGALQNVEIKHLGRGV